ncbi:MAG: hypothetical protein LBU57_01210 [Dysgonamonadaceae bacterium]|nr:hypothetical protein [Dysgonamonadaceae bacterium]
MNNIIFKKVWQDADIINIKISAVSKFATAYQTCYIQVPALIDAGEKLAKYTNTDDLNLYIEFGHKDGKYTPAFSMNISKVDALGHLNIEVDIEIADNNERNHRCWYFVTAELGALGILGEQLKNIATADVGEECSLYERNNESVLVEKF